MVSEMTVIDAMNGMGQDAECARILRREVLRLDDAHAERTRLFRKEWGALRAERDTLAARLATLTQEGIVVGEDGAVRWHGMTGREIEGMKEWVATRQRVIDSMKHRPHYCENDEDEIALNWRNGEKHLTVYAPVESLTWVASWGADVNTEMHDGNGSPEEMLRWLWGAFAATAGRGADGDATK